MDSAWGRCSVCRKMVLLYKERPMMKDSPLVASSHNALLTTGQKSYVACLGSRRTPLNEVKKVAQK